MRRSAMRVGDISGRGPGVAAARPLLSRLMLRDEDSALEAVRRTLYDYPAIDIVNDPLGHFHEAVPQESLVYVGAQSVAQALALSLPRFFEPLCYRRLGFELRHVAAEGAASLLFGDGLEPGLGAPRGQMQILWRETALQPSLAHGSERAPAHWRAGQGRAVIALGQDGRSHGLMRVLLGDSPADQALVIRPGLDAPRLALHALAPLPDPGAVAPVLGASLSEAQVTHDRAFETFHARFDGQPVEARLIPDSQFSRLLTRPRQAVDLLEVLGVFLPVPGRTSRVEGVAMRFDAERRLMAHESRLEEARIVQNAHGDVTLLRAGAQPQAVPRRGGVPGMGLSLREAATLDRTLPPRWQVLLAEGGEPLGWIPLRLHEAPPLGSNLVRESRLRLLRTGWVGPEAVDPDGAAIHLDWLDQAVPMVTRDEAGGTVAGGLAAWCLDQPDMAEASLRAEPGLLRLDRPRAQAVMLEDRATFRLGPLWVRLHRAGGWSG